MLKFRDSEGCEAYISDVGCLVIKQHNFELGVEVSVILTPAMAYEIARMIDYFHAEMVFEWADGLIQRDEPDQTEDKNGTDKNH
jgi:hypothetical protein